MGKMKELYLEQQQVASGSGDDDYIYEQYLTNEKMNELFMEYANGREFEVYDEQTGKTLIIGASSNEEAEGISETIDFNDYEDGDEYYKSTYMPSIEEQFELNELLKK